MTRFSPFAALRYSSPVRPAACSTVVAPPYDVLSDADRIALEALDARNSVRIDYPHGATDPGAYAGVRVQLERWIADGTIAVDETPTFTIYRMTTRTGGSAQSTTGVIGGLGLEPPGHGDVLPHEETTSKDKADRLELIRASRVNTSPIWGLSLASGLGALCARLVGTREPDAEAADADGVLHETWAVDDAADIDAIRTLVETTPIVIADGHHRFETALAYQHEMPAAAGAGAIMALIVELAEDELTVRGIHRIITLPVGVDPLDAFSAWFSHEPITAGDSDMLAVMKDRGGLILRTSGGTWLLRPRDGAFPEGTSLDSQRAAAVIGAVEGAAVRFHHDVATVLGAAASADSATNTVGLLLRPATVAQIRAVAHARTRMPAKTTFFWPKPRTGMLFRPVD